MRRRFNYTGRKKIRQKNISITMLEKEGGELSFFMELRLVEDEFPSGSNIWVEIYDRNTVERFEFGTVEATGPHGEKQITAFSGSEPFYFRVKIVDDQDRAKLLGLAKNLNAIDQKDEDQPGRSLLKVGTKELDGRPWKLEFDGSDHPTLFIDREIDAGVSLARTNTFFQSIVFPGVMEDILYRILMEDEYTPSGQPEPEDAWREGWLDFSANLPGNSSFPTDQALSTDEIKQWIESAVDGFCRSSNALRKLRVALKEIEV